MQHHTHAREQRVCVPIFYFFSIFRRVSAGVASKRDHPDSVRWLLCPSLLTITIPQNKYKATSAMCSAEDEKKSNQEHFRSMRLDQAPPRRILNTFHLPCVETEEQQRQLDTGHWTPAFLFFLDKTPRTHTPSFFHGVPRGSIWQSSLFICKQLH